MIFLNEGDKIFIQGSGKKPYEVRKVGGVVDCSCPAWRNLGGPIDVRVCKHIKANIDPKCLLPQAQAAMGIGGVKVPVKANTSGPKLTRTGKLSTAIKQVVVKDTAPPVLLAHKWENEDPTGWWMSEKLDGVRAWWDGKNFISRLGNTYHAPEWFKRLLPKAVLDGELFIGRGKFQQTVSVVRKLVPDDKEWTDVTYVMYDAPNVKGKFEDRIKYLEKIFPPYASYRSAGFGHVAVLEQVRCENLEHLKKYLTTIESFGGEGVMLRKPDSLYEEGRSATLLKVKTFIDDEATVVELIPGRGKHKGRLGALRVKWGKKVFKIGTGFSDDERRRPPKIGDKVTFRYRPNELTKDGLPRSAAFVVVRDYE